MKQNYLLLGVLLGVMLISCNDDDDKGPSYNFKDQDASGKINNQAFTYADGYADIDGETIRITLTLPQTEEGCAMGWPEGDYVFFHIENAVKLTPLSFGSTNGQTVTLLEAADMMNWIASDGAVEITSITETEVSGKIDARSHKETFINGNFTVPVCTP